MSKTYDVVISGMAGEFPECDKIDDFAYKLFNKENMVTDDGRRWPSGYRYQYGSEIVPSATGKYREINKLDARVFQINHILANCNDIINRKILEPAYECIIDAGINPLALSGANVGVYAGCWISEGDTIISLNKTSGTKPLYLIGSNKAMIANRISFALNLLGPSFTINSYTAGMEALTLAYKHISDGTVDAALVGAAGFLCDPKLSVHLLRFGFLSPDGISRVYDELANGYARSEAAGCLFLQRAEDAKRIYGTLLNTGVQYVGECITKPLANVQEDQVKMALQYFYEQWKINPNEVSFVETNGCGVPWLDCIEANAIANLFCKERESQLLVGSVKSNVGHCEGTSSIVSIIKSLIALDTGYIPPNINFNKPNKKIKAFAEEKLKVVSEKTELPGPLVAVSSIGIGGEIGHAVFKQNDRAPTKESEELDDLPRLVFLFGRTENGLKEVMEKVEKMPFHKEFIYLANDVFKMNVNYQLHRGYVLIPPAQSNTSVQKEMDVVLEFNRPIWFVFSGMGSQWNGMGDDLLNIPIFADTIDKIDRVVKSHNINIRHLLTSKDPELFDNVANSLAGIMAVQVGLVNVLRAIGVKPDGIIGHSLGETACAYADGCITAEQAVLAAYYRGLGSLHANTIKGLMASIGKGYEQIKDFLSGDIEIACHNSADNCTISGPEDQITEFVQKMQKDGIFAKIVKTGNIAYHSKHIAPAKPLLQKYFEKVGIKPKLRSKIWVSTSTPKEQWDSDAAKYSTASYHINNFLNPVLFEEGCKYIPDNAIIIELAPHGLLQAILKRSMNRRCTNIPLTIRSESINSVSFLLSAIGKLYLAGCEVDVNALFPKIQFPVPRNTPSLAPLVTWDHFDEWDVVHPIRDNPISERLIKICLNKGTEYSFLGFHEVKNQCIIPPAFYMYLVWHILSLVKKQKVGDTSIVFENIRVHRNLVVTIEKHTSLTVLIQYGSGSFEVLLHEGESFDDVVVVMTGQIYVPYDQFKAAPIEKDAINNIDKARKLTHEEFYKDLEEAGYQLNGIFANINEVVYNEQECYGKISWNNNWTVFLDALMKMFTLTEKKESDEILFPERIIRLKINADVFASLKPGDEIICRKDQISKQVLCDGLEIIGLLHKPLDVTDLFGIESETKLTAAEFVPYIEPFVQNRAAFIQLALQLTIENAPILTKDVKAKVHVIDTQGNSVLMQIKDIVKHNRNLKNEIVFHKYSPKNAKGKNKCYLVTADDLYDEDNVGLLRQDNLFILSAMPTNVQIHSNEINKDGSTFVVVSKKTFQKEQIVLFKKLGNAVLNGCINYEIIMAGENSKTKSTQTHAKLDLSKPTIAVWDRYEPNDLSILLPKKTDSLHIRNVFILDQKAPPFSVDKLLYKNQITKDLITSVYQNGQWGTYRSISDSDILQRNNNKNELIELQLPTDIRIESVSIEYLGIGSETIITDKSKNTIYELEYSGILQSGEPVMGLTSYNSAEPAAEKDPYFTWSVPNGWTIEEAATVPFVYVQAYNIINNVTRTGIFELALIHAGDTPFGEACLNVLSSDKNFRIFTTVSNEEGIKTIMEKFPNIKHTDIFLNCDCDYDIKLLLLTQGNGVGLIINPLTGIDHMNATLNCVGISCQYHCFGEENFRGDDDLGLFQFIKSVSFYAIPNRIAPLLNLDSDIKQKLHRLVNDGIKSGIVKPLQKETYTRSELLQDDGNDLKLKPINKKRVLRYFSDADNINLDTEYKLNYNSKNSYIILGGKKTNAWYDLVEWLIGRGVRKFLIATENFALNTKLSHQINKLLTQKKATIVLTSIQNADTIRDSKKLINDASKMGPLEAIFFVTVDSNDPKIRNMDIASRSLERPCHFISLMSGGLDVCESRRYLGLPAIIINAKADKTSNRLPSLLPHLKDIFSCTDINNPPAFYNYDDVTSSDKDTGCILLNQYVPIVLDDLDDIDGKFEYEHEEYFIEVASLAVKYSESRGVYPIFVIPALGRKYLSKLIQKLMYPVFLANLPDYFISCVNIANHLLKGIEKIQPEGPVTVLGELWCGSIAIELARLLKESGRDVQLYLIEGSPAMWQKIIRSIGGEVNTTYFDNNFLKHIFGGINSNTVQNTVTDGTVNNNSWESLVWKYIRNITSDIDKANNICRTISTIRNRLIASSQYTPTDVQLKHVIHFKQYNTSIHHPMMEQYSMSDEVHLFEDGKYEDFLKNTALATVINEEAFYSWNFPKI